LGFESFPKRECKRGLRPRLALARRRATIRRKLYGKPDYVEGYHCWKCRINLVEKSTNKWFCADCLDERNRLSRKQLRKHKREQKKTECTALMKSTPRKAA